MMPARDRGYNTFAYVRVLSCLLKTIVIICVAVISCYIASFAAMPGIFGGYIEEPSWASTDNPASHGYRDVLPPEHQQIYDSFEKALRDHDPFFPIFPGSISEDAFSDILVAVLYDNPDIFWSGPGYTYIPLPDGNFAGVFPHYLFDEQESIEEHTRYMKQVLDTTAQLRRNSSNLTGQYLSGQVYDEVISSLEYAHNSHDQNITAFFWEDTQGYATCAGYAKTYKLLCDAFGIECYVIRGHLYGSENASHAWNMVRLTESDNLGRSILFSDPTWGDRESREDGAIPEMWNTTSGRFYENSHIPDKLCSKMAIVKDGIEQTRIQDEMTPELAEGAEASTDNLPQLRLEDVLKTPESSGKMTPEEWKAVFDADEDAWDEMATGGSADAR